MTRPADRLPRNSGSAETRTSDTERRARHDGDPGVPCSSTRGGDGCAVHPGPWARSARKVSARALPTPNSRLQAHAFSDPRSFCPADPPHRDRSPLPHELGGRSAFRPVCGRGKRDRRPRAPVHDARTGVIASDNGPGLSDATESCIQTAQHKEPFQPGRQVGRPCPLERSQHGGRLWICWSEVCHWLTWSLACTPLTSTDVRLEKARGGFLSAEPTLSVLLGLQARVDGGSLMDIGPEQPEQYRANRHDAGDREDRCACPPPLGRGQYRGAGSELFGQCVVEPFPIQRRIVARSSTRGCRSQLSRLRSGRNEPSRFGGRRWSADRRHERGRLFFQRKPVRRCGIVALRRNGGRDYPRQRWPQSGAGSLRLRAPCRIFGGRRCGHARCLPSARFPVREVRRLPPESAA